MSILNHFGKVKASYKKYESELPEYKGYVHVRLSDNYRNPGHGLFNVEYLVISPLLENGKCISGEMVYGEQFKRKKFKADKELIHQCYRNQIITAATIKNHYNNPGLELGSQFFIPVSRTYNPAIGPELYVFSFTTLVETFSKCLEKVREKLSSELWKTIEYWPLITIIDLLLLKQSDTDKHIEHLEVIVKALIDDTKLLQTKINSLESQMSLFKSKLPVAVAVSEKTIAEVILCE